MSFDSNTLYALVAPGPGYARARTGAAAAAAVVAETSWWEPIGSALRPRAGDDDLAAFYRNVDAMTGRPARRGGSAP